MTHLFYLTGLLFIWRELLWIYSPKEQVEKIKAYNELSKLNKGKKWDDFTPEYKSALKGNIHLLIIFLWLFIGLFTFQWDVFLFMLVFNLVIIAPLSRLTRYSYVYMAIHWVNSVIGFAFGVFVIINHYHLQISFYKFALQLVS